MEKIEHCQRIPLPSLKVPNPDDFMYGLFHRPKKKRKEKKRKEKKRKEKNRKEKALKNFEGTKKEETFPMISVKPVQYDIKNMKKTT